MVKNREDFLKKLPEYSQELGDYARNSAGIETHRALNVALRQKLQHQKRVKGSDLNVVTSSLTLTRGQLENQLIVYANGKNAPPLDRTLMMRISNVVPTPVYALPICVMEIVGSIMMQSCGLVFIQSLWNQIEKSRVKRPILPQLL